MAYINYMASVPAAQIDRFRKGELAVLEPTRVNHVSHLLATWITLQPLGQLLREALDGGEILAQGYWHPFRLPMVHGASEIFQLLTAIEEAVPAEDATVSTEMTDWYKMEINTLLGLLRHAAQNGEAVVSVLNPPMGGQRSAQTQFPFKVACG